MSAITSFHGTYRFLSNFYPAEVQYDGETYRTVEHAFQAAKTTDLQQRANIRACPTPGRAKRLGRMVDRIPNWDDVRIEVMLGLLRQKFSDPDLGRMLWKTGDLKLIEGNTWGDRFWGAVVVLQPGNPCSPFVGENHLGKLLMQVRKEMNK